MKILIYASQPGFSTNRLMEEIEKANKRNPGEEITGEVVSAYDLHSYISETTAGHDKVFKRGAEKSRKLIAKEINAIIPRLAGAGFDFGLGNVRHITET